MIKDKTNKIYGIISDAVQRNEPELVPEIPEMEPKSRDTRTCARNYIAISQRDFKKMYNINGKSHLFLHFVLKLKKISKSFSFFFL